MNPYTKFLTWLQMIRDMSASVAAIEAKQLGEAETVAEEIREMRLLWAESFDRAEKDRGAIALELTQLIGVLESHHEVGHDILMKRTELIAAGVAEIMVLIEKLSNEKEKPMPIHTSEERAKRKKPKKKPVKMKQKKMIKPKGK